MNRIHTSNANERCLTYSRSLTTRGAGPAENDADTAAIRALNAKIAGDVRVDLSMVPTGDGLTIARKR